MPVQSSCLVKGKLGRKLGLEKAWFNWGARSHCGAGKSARARALQLSGWIRNARKLNHLRIDPTRTITLRRAFQQELRKRWRNLKLDLVKLIVDEDAFGLRADSKAVRNVDRQLTSNQRWRFNTAPEKVKAFQGWLRQQFHARFLKEQEEELWRKYVEDGFRKGAGRAFDDVRKRKFAPGEGEFYKGSKQQFLRSSFGQPVSVDKVKLLAGRQFSDLKGITEEMSARMSRVLTDGLVQGRNPRDLAKSLNEQLDLGEARSEVIARTEIIRAHAEGQLNALEDLGVEEVGVAVEWSTAGDDRVCPLCEELERVVLKIDEARGMLPRHPQCRCAWVPANVGEDAEQKATKSAITKAIRASVDREEQGEGEKETKWAGADREIAKRRPEPLVQRFFPLSPAFSRPGLRQEPVSLELLAFSQFLAFNRSFFADCDCDEKGRCLPAGTMREGFARPGEQERAVKLARSKIKSVPVPSADDVRKARDDMAFGSRVGGDARGGSAADRRRQRQNLFREFGGEENGYVVCPWTGLKMHWTDNLTVNTRSYPKFERGKIFTKKQGGGYQLSNLIPESFAANRSRNDIPLRKENLK